MELQYLCPHCRGAFNALGSIILSAKTEDKKSGLVLLHEEIGDYSSTHTATLHVEPGEVIDFFCPLCHESLNTRRGEHFAHFIRIDEVGKESKIIISRKCGEEATFKIEDGKAVESYGESVRKYMDPEWYLEG